MKLTLVREIFTDKFTLGRLYIEDAEFCYTVEDAVRDAKIIGETAIPYGCYPLTIEPSPRFKKNLPRLHNVPNFAGVLIHSGNSAKDTEGCLIVGLTRTSDGVGRSRDAMKELQPILQHVLDRGEKVEIEIAKIS